MTAAGVSDLNDDSLAACTDALKGKKLHEVIQPIYVIQYNYRLSMLDSERSQA